MADEYDPSPLNTYTSPSRYAGSPRGSGQGHTTLRPVPTDRDQQPTEKRSRRRAPKACGECRRLKLKCDRIFPCQSCVKRGCEGICPDGSLVSGRGSRYILANTEQLHDKITIMADRIRELEDALRVMSDEHAQCPNNTFKYPPGVSHPLLSEERLRIKSSLELYGLTHPSHSAANARRSPSGSISDDSELDGSRFSSLQTLVTPPTGHEHRNTDMQHQYFHQSQGQSNSSTFSTMNSQPAYSSGTINTYNSSAAPVMGTSTMWDPELTSPTIRTDLQPFADSYSTSSPAVPTPQHMNTFSGDLYQTLPYQSTAQVSFPTSYPPIHLPEAHDMRSAMSDEELLRRYRT